MKTGVATDEIGSFWYLEGYIDSRRRSWRTIIDSLPMTVGRGDAADLQVFSTRVSHRHAQLFRRDGRLWIRDLESTNGTRLNHEPVTTEAALSEGDLLHFADLEFRLAVYRPAERARSTATKAIPVDDLSDYLSVRDAEFDEMLRCRAVLPLFQPVVSLSDRGVRGFELLSRGTLEGYETSPVELFYIAERLGRELELSALFRATGIAEAERLTGSPLIFINTHPAEIRSTEDLLRSLADLRRRHPALPLALEIHEAAVTEPRAMRELRYGLTDLQIQLAFDDFGTGQSRLLEIAEVPPDYVKFDMGFVRDLHLAAQRRREVLLSLVRMAHDTGIVAIAEGIETEEEEQACGEVGFRFAQGYHLGIPSPVPDPDEPQSG